MTKKFKQLRQSLSAEALLKSKEQIIKLLRQAGKQRYRYNWNSNQWVELKEPEWGHW